VAWEEFVSRHHREPSSYDLAALLGVPLAAVLEVRAARGVDHVSLPDPALSDEPERVDLLADASDPVGLEERVALTLALGELGERERAIVLGTYGAGLTQTEIGRRLGLSQSHVSKLLARALGQLGVLVA
jgi:RNA polymerase sigma-B factor